MASETDDIEQELRRNLELRRKLGAKAKDGSANQDDGSFLDSTAEGAETDDLEKLRLELKLRRAVSAAAAAKGNAGYQRDQPPEPGRTGGWLPTGVIWKAWVIGGLVSLALAAFIALWLIYGWPSLPELWEASGTA